jgi:hypothetical protein
VHNDVVARSGNLPGTREPRDSGTDDPHFSSHFSMFTGALSTFGCGWQ